MGDEPLAMPGPELSAAELFGVSKAGAYHNSPGVYTAGPCQVRQLVVSSPR